MNYTKVAFRRIRKEKGYTFINVLGLALGVGCCLLIGLYVHDELSYDRFHVHADRIYRIDEELDMGGGLRRWAFLSVPHAPALEAELLEIETAVRFFQRSFVLGTSQVQLDGVRIAYVDPEALAMFSFPVQAGDPATMLDQPGSIVLTTETKSRLFGTTPALGETVVQENKDAFVVTGVIERPPNSHFTFDALLPIERAIEENPWLAQWGASTTNTYVLLRDGVAPAALRDKFDAFLERHFGEYADSRTLHLHPLTDIHLRPATTGATGTIGIVSMLAAVGLLVLIVASINYVNLATAQATGRIKEVGMRKTLGASQGQVVAQMLGESVLLALAALGVGLALAWLALPFLNDLAGKTLSLHVLGTVSASLVLVAGTVLIGIGAGVYPAFFLARFQPVRVLKGRQYTSKGSPLLRQSLVVVQFVAAVVLIVGTLVIQRQLTYLSNQELGFSGEQVIAITRQGNDQTAIETFKRELLRLPSVRSVGRSSGKPGYLGWFMTMNPAEEVTTERTSSLVTFMVGDEDYLPTMGMELVSGRNFSAARGTDVDHAVLINETAVRVLGFHTPEEALGQVYHIGQYENAEVVGVIRDFHYASLRQEVEPLAIAFDAENISLLNVKVAPNDMPQTLAAIEATWDRVLGDWPFTYSFVDEDFAALYRSEQRAGQLLGVFTGLAVLVACLGLFGLAAYTAAQRTKEIGIRKVLGASFHSIVALMSKDVLKLVLLGIVLATPVAYVAAERWLNGFASRIAIGPGVFMVAGGLALLIAFATVSYHAVRAALADPVKALRYE